MKRTKFNVTLIVASDEVLTPAEKRELKATIKAKLDAMKIRGYDLSSGVIREAEAPVKAAPKAKPASKKPTAPKAKPATKKPAGRTHPVEAEAPARRPKASAVKKPAAKGPAIKAKSSLKAKIGARVKDAAKRRPLKAAADENSDFDLED